MPNFQSGGFEVFRESRERVPMSRSSFFALGLGEVESYVFPSKCRKGHVSRQAIGDVCRNWGRVARFHVHPHQLRHSYATHALQRGVEVFTFQATLGHLSSETKPVLLVQ